MYFNKDFLLNLYKSLSSLYSGTDIEAQGGTQFVSELKYFFAIDYFKKQKGKPCDSNIKEDKDFFVLSVGKIILLSENGSFLATKNFANSVGDARDFDVGSNFFSANAVAKSKISSEPQKFPNRHPQLLSIRRGIIDTYSGGYENLAKDKEYLGGNIKKYAILFLWLNRFSNFNSNESVYNDSLFNLKKDFSSELVSALKWTSTDVKNEVEKLLENVQLEEAKSEFTREDFSKKQEQTDVFSSEEFNYIKIPVNIDLNTNRTQIKNELIEKLNNIEAAEKDDGFNLLSQLVLFGIQNGKIITENDISPNELASESNISDNYHQHLRFGIQIYNHAKDNKLVDTCDKFEHKTLVRTSFLSNFIPSQIIYYGVPGSGKSHKIDEETKALPDEQKMRVVFHPEYTNADFVGQILPVIEEGSGVRYAFKPGAFTKILIEALKNPSKPYYLIIEEINRGNAAAIFGEIFQLLDRGNDGWSSYCIMNDDINYEIRKSAPELNWTENTGIRLPPNLSLLATMNTSDQNVFTLDNAFQRRWNMELVKNECSDTNQMDATIAVNNQKISWEDFQQTINSVIGEKSNEGGLSSMEDKRLGCWFVKAENGAISKEIFANKVLKYLWDDAFKFCHQEIFGSEIKNFEDLQKKFFEKGFEVFSESCGLSKVVSTSSTTETADSKENTEQPEA